VLQKGGLGRGGEGKEGARRARGRDEWKEGVSKLDQKFYRKVPLGSFEQQAESLLLEHFT
jgi:hypothetical protein